MKQNKKKLIEKEIRLVVNSNESLGRGSWRKMVQRYKLSVISKY